MESKPADKRISILTALRPSLLLNWWRIWKTLPVISWIQAAEHFKRGEFRKAAECYERGLKKHPNHKASTCARLDRAYCLYQLEEIAPALAELRELVREKAPLKDAFLFLAKLQLITGHYSAAARTMKRALEFFQSDTQVTLCYAYCVMSAQVSANQLHSLKNYLSSLRNQMAVTDPMSVSLDTTIAWYEMHFGDSETGEKILARVLATGEAPFEAVLLRGERWLEQGRIEPAREQLQRAMRMCPQDPRPMLLLAKSYLEDSQRIEPEYALQLATTACAKSHWENQDCLAVLAECYRRMDDEDTSMLVNSRIKAISSVQQVNLETLSQTGENLARIRSSKFYSA